MRADDQPAPSVPIAAAGRKGGAMRIGYFVNQYPAVSHTFIRREIRALEDLGVEVVRYALRAQAQGLTDPEDHRERERTRYVLAAGAAVILGCVAKAMLHAAGGRAGAR